ncbi:MFS transporter [Thermomicrobium sp. 4228-Ro]|uniref:MFS transporter n=1 Tax=Thermomicrobium sp. 4228-Ro TaxID=2993937 RepID=UPI002249796F|nr:MFS transporter [Thermomicrobium sp. 4228-Ro]MCX2728346.1 MFS transporter [Thermomicrobium sp. 4228-Ro]
MAQESDDARSMTDRVDVLYSLRMYPAFRVLFGTTLTTNAAFWMWSLLAGWLALLLTDSPFFVGLTGFLSGIPMLIVSLPAGVLIDRFDRRFVLLAAQVVVALVTVVLVLFLWFGWLHPWQLLLAAFLSGAGMAFVFATRSALVGNLVGREALANAVALTSTAQNAPRIVGPALAGPLVGLLGMPGAFAVCAVFQVLSVVITVRLPRVRPTTRRSGFWRSFVEGLEAVWRREQLRALMGLAALPTLLVFPYTNFLPVFARDELGLGATGLGVLMALNGLGAVIGSVAVAARRRFGESPRILVASVLAFAAAVFAFAHAPVPWLAALFLFVAGATGAVYMASTNTLLQLAVDDQIRGRVLSVYLLTWGLLPVGTLPAGAIADVWGAPRAVTLLTLSAMLAIVMVAARFPILRRPTLLGEQPRAVTRVR